MRPVHSAFCCFNCLNRESILAARWAQGTHEPLNGVACPLCGRPASAECLCTRLAAPPKLHATNLRSLAPSPLARPAAPHQADKFHKTGRQLRSRMWWQNFKMKIIIAAIIILVAIIIFCSGAAAWGRAGDVADWLLRLCVQCGSWGGRVGL